MKIQAFHLYSYQLPLKTRQIRAGMFIHIKDEQGNDGWGEIAPLPGWSKETLEDAVVSLQKRWHEIVNLDWTSENCLQELAALKLLPSVTFGLESAILSIIHPFSVFRVQTSALFMGSPIEIMEQANCRQREGYTSAKLKVSHLSFKEAFYLINRLKDMFRLKIDVNRAWNTSDSLRFFSQFPLDAFEYIEEPFQNCHELREFLHPLAIDESFPNDLSLKQLETLPTLKALIYKPTIQGGMVGCLSLYEWAKKRGIGMVLSSSFESDLGLAYVASIAHRLGISTTIGIGTYHFLQEYVCAIPLQFLGSVACIPTLLTPRRSIQL